MTEKAAILLVDDQNQNIELLEAFLNPEGYTTVSATDGAAALDMMARMNVDLVLSDIMMPGMDGLEFTRRLRMDDPNHRVPVVMVTALKEREDKIRCVEAGCDDFLSKPVDKIELLARVRSLLKVKAYNDLSLDYQARLEKDIITAMTKLKHTFEENKKLERQLFHSRKMEAIGRLAGGIAHDFNNILQVIQGFTDHLISKTPAEDQRSEWLRQIRVASDRATSLIQGLLAFSHKQQGDSAPVDINEGLRKISPMLDQLLGRKILLSMNLAPGLGKAMCDKDRMDMVWMNLATNAKDAMPDGGKLLFATENVTLRPTAADGAEGGDGVGDGVYVRINVTDTGNGMDPQTMEHMFEPFFTTKTLGKGTGLGLATVYGIVKQAGGHVRCESSPGCGTTFVILLPGAKRDIP